MKNRRPNLETERQEPSRVVGEYKGLEVRVTKKDFFVTKEEIAVLSRERQPKEVGAITATGTCRIFIREEVYMLISQSGQFEDLLEIILEHEYKEFLAMTEGKALPDHGGKDYKKLNSFLREKGYCE